MLIIETDVWADEDGRRQSVSRFCVKCDHCYADTFSRRLGMKVWGHNAPRRIASEKTWRDPLARNRKAERIGKRLRVFCMSMGDFLEDRADLVEPRKRAIEVVESTPHLDWLILTRLDPSTARERRRVQAGRLLLAAVEPACRRDLEATHAMMEQAAELL